MANGKKGDDPSESSSKSTKDRRGKTLSSSSSSSDETENVDEKSAEKSTEHRGRNPLGTSRTGGQDFSRREENPFSFKHFLKNDSQTKYYHAGARPKVYSSPVSSPNSHKKETNIYARNPTELPDFVQDHLVIEQCYLERSSNPKPMPDVDNLPDFAQSSMEQRQNRLCNDARICQSKNPIEISINRSVGDTQKHDSKISHIQERPSINASHSGPLDLPSFERPIIDLAKHSQPAGFPLDLPFPVTESNVNANMSLRNGSLTVETHATKLLPDFLNDGPIKSRSTQSTDVGLNASPIESIERRFQMENNRLRQELEIARIEINEKTKRIRVLERELVYRKEIEHEETAHIEKAMEQVEDNLKRSTKRAINAESTVSNLKKEIKELTTEISLLRMENRELRSAMSSRGECSASSPQTDQRMQRLASDLRNAASTAELSLRQLMSGVENLRVLASTLENADRIEDRTKDFLPDYDEDNASGPAL